MKRAPAGVYDTAILSLVVGDEGSVIAVDSELTHCGWHGLVNRV